MQSEYVRNVTCLCAIQRSWESGCNLLANDGSDELHNIKNFEWHPLKSCGSLFFVAVLRPSIISSEFEEFGSQLQPVLYWQISSSVLGGWFGENAEEKDAQHSVRCSRWSGVNMWIGNASTGYCCGGKNQGRRNISLFSRAVLPVGWRRQQSITCYFEISPRWRCSPYCRLLPLNI